MDDGWQSAVSGLKEVLALFKDGGLGDAALPDQQRRRSPDRIQLDGKERQNYPEGL